MTTLLADSESRLLALDRELLLERDYWLERCSGEFSFVSLDPDRNVPADPSPVAASLVIKFSREIRERLSQLTDNSPFLLYSTLTAALNAVFFLTTGQSKIAIHSPARKQVDGPAGSPNLLLIINDLNKDLSFRELLLSVRETLLQSYRRQRYPFDRLMRDLKGANENGGRRAHGTILRFPELHETSPKADFDLDLEINRDADGISVRAVYDSRLYRSETIKQFGAHLEMVLGLGLSDSSKSLSELFSLSKADEEIVLKQGTGEGSDVSAADSCFHYLFEEGAARYPDAGAIIADDVFLSYQELDCRADQLADYLRRQGVKAEDLVGICLERSINLIIAMLATMKAGGGYVPLDPGHPRERLNYMLNDSSVRLVITDSSLVHLFPNRAGLVLLDIEASHIATQPLQRPPRLISPGNIAYVIYTSGTTGRPKGVVIEHRGIGHLAHAQIRTFEINKDSRVLQFAPFGFDASVSEIAMTFLSGATLCLEPQAAFVHGADILGTLANNNITAVTLPPALMGAFTPADLPALRTVISAGDRCPPAVVDAWIGRRKFFNAYGPTETTVCATIFDCVGQRIVTPIGKPIEKTRVYVLDEEMRLVHAGVKGELYIGGHGLARGYLD